MEISIIKFTRFCINYPYSINGIYTKPVIFGHRPARRLSIISPIVAVIFCKCYSTICTKSVVIAYKNSYKQPLYFGIPIFFKLDKAITQWNQRKSVFHHAIYIIFPDILVFIFILTASRPGHYSVLWDDNFGALPGV